MNETKMTELAQAEDMAFFRADLCLYSPESYTLDEKKEICNDMFKTSKAIQDAMRADFERLAPGRPRQAPGHALCLGRRVAPVVVGRARRRRRPALPRVRAASIARPHTASKEAVYRR